MPDPKDKKAKQDPFDFGMSMDFNMDVDLDLDKPAGNVREGGLNRARTMLHPDVTMVEADVPDDADMEEASEAEVTSVLAKVRENAAKSQARIEANTTSQYYFTVVFLDRKQRDAFLNATGWVEFGKRCVDGIALAKKLGVTLPESAYQPQAWNGDRRYGEIAFEIGETPPFSFGDDE